MGSPRPLLAITGREILPAQLCTSGTPLPGQKAGIALLLAVIFWRASSTVALDQERFLSLFSTIPLALPASPTRDSWDGASPASCWETSTTPPKPPHST